MSRVRAVARCLWLLAWLAGLAGVGRASPPAYPTLRRQPHAALAVYCTPGAEARTARMAVRCGQALAWLRQPAQLGFAPRVTLLVLGPADWRRYAANPVYGMPHTAGAALIVAADDNELWRNTLPPAARLPPALAAELAATYRGPAGQASLDKFFDLLALHELAHLAYRQGRRDCPRHWLEELFCNVLLHSFIASQEPARLPTLELYPRAVVVGTDPATLPHTTLADFERLYGRMEQQQPENYGWYQCRLHVAAARLYGATAGAALPRLWRALRRRAPHTDPELAAFLAARVGPELAQVQMDW